MITDITNIETHLIAIRCAIEHAQEGLLILIDNHRDAEPTAVCVNSVLTKAIELINDIQKEESTCLTN